MKKWAAWTYIGFSVLNQAVLIALGIWTLPALVIPAVVISFIVKHIRKMS